MAKHAFTFSRLLIYVLLAILNGSERAVEPVPTTCKNTALAARQLQSGRTSSGMSSKLRYDSSVLLLLLKLPDDGGKQRCYLVWPGGRCRERDRPFCGSNDICEWQLAIWISFTRLASEARNGLRLAR